MEALFENASRVMTVISFVTFTGILWWAYGRHSEKDFATAANLPFDDDKEDSHV
jgi:cytochrome c oxidase cbb3-type subunit 4